MTGGPSAGGAVTGGPSHGAAPGRPAPGGSVRDRSARGGRVPDRSAPAGTPGAGRGTVAGRWAVTGLCGLGVAAVVGGGWLGGVAGGAAAVAAYRLVRRVEPSATRAARIRATADLPLAADLLAAVLRAGAPVDRAVIDVATVIGGPLGESLARVGRELRLGAAPAEAWAHVSELPGAGRLAAAAVRASDSGAALARALVRLADDRRSDQRVAAETAARRAGVLIVLPLGLCFLPAFILAGLVPVIVAVLGDVL